LERAKAKASRVIEHHGLEMTMEIARDQITPDDRRFEFRSTAVTDSGTAITVIGGADGGTLPRTADVAGRDSVPALEPRTARRRLLGPRFRRNLRGTTATGAAPDAAGDALLEIALLREENLRLKGECHRPADLGVLIGQLRLAAAYELEVEDPDEGWTLLAECHRVHEQLRQAQLEVTTAITTLQARLDCLDGAHLALLDDGGDHFAARDAA
jgi:hypothetical protein